jgi:hypothetical protein
VFLKLVAALTLSASFAGAMTEKEASEDPRWLRLLQYEKSWSGSWTSDITAEPFFFAANGRRDPYAELVAAVKAYENPSAKFGVQEFPAACAFPARKRVLENLLARKFPSPDCPDLKTWADRIGADHLRLVFVGAYAGNPASILGHTFIRFANSGSDLLNYSVGFMAITDPADSRWTYMVKGITGGYDGFYEIEPHYMKVGLYNNSEARDLWEVKLNLTAEEVQLLVLHFWELTFNSKTPYFFIDENCSYRLIKFLEALRPDIDIADQLPAVVLPAETVRAAIASGLAEPVVHYRPSVKRRMEYKLSLLDEPTRAQALAARKSGKEINNLQDPTAVDALLDFWLYENFRRKTKLSPQQAAIMDATYQKVAALATPSKYSGVTPIQVREKFKLEPPFLAHPPRWFEGHLGTGENGATGGFKYRSGVHPFWSKDPGYADITAIEYLGAQIEWRKGEDTRWSATLIDVFSLTDFTAWDQRASWKFSIDLQSYCRICSTRQPQAHLTGGAGIAKQLGPLRIYILANIDGAAWLEDGTQGMLAPGLLAGGKLSLKNSSVTAAFTKHWWKNRDDYSAALRWSVDFSQSEFPFVELRGDGLRGEFDSLFAQAGWVSFF